MSVQSEIDRLAGAKAGLSSWLENNGVTVPAGTNLNGLVELLGRVQMGSNKQLFQNWYFPNAVNQRGVTSLTQNSTLKYFIDRWQVWDGTFAVTSNGLQVAWNGTSGYNARMRQRIEQKLFGETVTVSAVVDGVLYQAALVVPTTADEASYGSTVNGIQFMVQNHGNEYFSAGIVINETAARIVQSMKCEIGSVATLLQDAPPDYGEQLALCQRYFLRIPVASVFVGYWGSTTQARINIPLPVPMRIDTPTVTSPASDKMSCYAYSSAPTITITAFASGAALGGFLRVFATASAATAIKTYTNVAFRNEGYWDVSADL